MPGDAAELARIDRVTGATSWPDEAAYHRELARDDRRYLVARAGTDTAPILGFVGAALLADELHVMAIAVDPPAQRRGVGGRLLDALLELASYLDARGVTLEVREDNQPALALYRRAGFVLAGRRPRYYRDGADAAVLWWYPSHATTQPTVTATSASETT